MIDMDKTISQVIAEIENVIAEYRQKAVDIVEQQRQQNPSLNPIGDGSVCYTIKFSDLSPDKVLSPQFYNWEWQFDSIIKKMKAQTSLTTLRNVLERIVETGKLDGDRLHPEVIDVLKRVL